MFGFGKSARIEALEIENETLSYRLAEEKKRSKVSGRALSEALAERDAARIERDTAQRERDEYRPDALKHRSSRSHLKQYRQAAPVSAGQASGVEVH